MEFTNNNAMDPSALTWFLYRNGKQVIESELLISFVPLFLPLFKIWKQEVCQILSQSSHKKQLSIWDFEGKWKREITLFNLLVDFLKNEI